MNQIKSKNIVAVSIAIFLTLAITACTKKEKVEEETMSTQSGTAVLDTTHGKITIGLRPDLAPKHVENFKKLANDGFYNGTTFHRVIPGFMIQGGDPNSKSDDRSTHGFGGPGYTVDAEFSSEKHVRGVVSMARGGDPNSAGSQFFIVVADSAHLDGQYTVFGKVNSGMDVVDKIVSAEKDARDNPLQRIEIKSVSINEG